MKKAWLRVAAVVAAFAGGPAAADSVDAAPTAPTQELTEASAQALFDRAWQTELSAEGKIPGVVVTVVKDGRVLFAKGYGVADTDIGDAPDPARTRVRIGSVSKVFTALTALSYVDEGTIDLDTDINHYLKSVKVPATFPEPVTPRSMLSHLSGFDAGVSEYMVPTNAQVRPDPADLQRHLIRLRPVGLPHGYDNRAISLLGFAIGEMHGGGLAAAMKDRIFEPLGMAHSTMGIPDEVKSEVGACHTVDKHAAVVKCQHYLMRQDTQGAGDVTSTGADMSRFMLALLNGGELEGRRILSPALFGQFMDPDQNRWHPQLNGMGFIIFEGSLQGRRTMGHSGGQDGFGTMMTLFPESNTGVFMSVFTSFAGLPRNNDTLTYRIDLMKRGAAFAAVNQYGRMTSVMTSFAEQFIPPSPLKSKLSAPTKRVEPLSVLNGHFVANNANVFPLMERMFVALTEAGAMEVTVRGDDVFIAGQGPYREAEPYVLQKDGDPVRWIFTVRDGMPILNSTAGRAPSDFYQVKHYLSGRYTVLPLLAALIVSLTAGLYSLLRRTSTARTLTALVFLAGGAALVGLLCEFQLFGHEYFSKGGSALMVGWRMLINAGWLAALVAFGLALWRYRSWARWQGIGGVLESSYVTLTCLSALVLAALLTYWGLIGNFSH